MDATEFSVDETHGFLARSEFHVHRSSAGLGWKSVFLSMQSEDPYVGKFGSRAAILILLVDEGSIRAKIGTRDGEHCFRAPMGSIVIIPDGTEFAIESQASIRSTHIYIRRDVLVSVAGRTYRGCAQDIRITPRMGVFDPVLHEICHAIRDVVGEGSDASRLYVEHMAHALAAQLVLQHSTASSRRHEMAEGGLSSKQLDRLYEMVDANLGLHLTNAELASGSGMSAEHFGRLFKRTTGMTLYRFVIGRRIEKARRLLEETQLPIIEIAHECGFADQVHLTRLFGRIIGNTPAAFRKERQK